MIADLQERLSVLERRKETRKLRSSPGHKKLLTALRLVEKAYTTRENDEDRAFMYFTLDVRQRMASYFKNCGAPQGTFDLPRKGPPPKLARVETGYGDPDAHA